MSAAWLEKQTPPGQSAGLVSRQSSFTNAAAPNCATNAAPAQQAAACDEELRNLLALLVRIEHLERRIATREERAC